MTGVSLDDVLYALRYANSGCTNVMDKSTVWFEIDRPLMEVFPPDVPALPYPYHKGVEQNILVVSVFGIEKVHCIKTGHEKWSVEGVILISPGVVWKVSIRIFLSKTDKEECEILLHERCKGDVWTIQSV